MTCKYCHLYHENLNETCKVCDTPPPQVIAEDNPLTPYIKHVPIAPVAKPVMSPRISNILMRLRKAGMATDNQIADGLRTGAVSQVLGFAMEYGYTIDYLVGKGYDVERYRHRVVCGSAEAEYGRRAA